MIHHVFRRRKLKIESEPSQPQQKERKKERKKRPRIHTQHLFAYTFEILISFNIIKILGCIVFVESKKIICRFFLYI